MEAKKLKTNVEADVEDLNKGLRNLGTEGGRIRIGWFGEDGGRPGAPLRHGSGTPDGS